MSAKQDQRALVVAPFLSEKVAGQASVIHVWVVWNKSVHIAAVVNIVTGNVSCRYVPRDGGDLTSLQHYLDLYCCITLLPQGRGFSLEQCARCSWVPGSWAQLSEFIAPQLWWEEQGRDAFQAKKEGEGAVFLYRILFGIWDSIFRSITSLLLHTRWSIKSSLSIYLSVKR